MCAGAWASPLPRLLPLLSRSAVPISGPMLGRSALYAPGGAPLVQLGRDEERMALAHLPLLQPPGTAEAARGSSRAVASEVAAAVGAAAAASAAAGAATPYAHYFGGFVVEPVSWHMCLGFPLMEALGSLSYHAWRAPLRRRVAAAIARDGAWQGPVPPL